VPRLLGPIVPPGPAGGLVPPGTYRVTLFVEFGPGDADGGPVPFDLAGPETLRLGGGSFDWVFGIANPVTWWSGRLQTSETEMTLDVLCPSARPGALMEYGVMPSGFWTCAPQLAPADDRRCGQYNGDILRVFAPAP
jgi:hypothetical protein